VERRKEDVPDGSGICAIEEKIVTCYVVSEETKTGLYCP
jgi:hypothetical protein